MSAALARLPLLAAALLVCGAAAAQSGLRPPQLDAPGLDPALARGWFMPQYDRFGFASQAWRDSLGFAPARRMQWSYDLTSRASLSMSYLDSRQSDLETRPLSLFGRYWLSSDWALSAESMSRDASGLLRLHDVRIGVQRSF
ncbi:MAG TPA: hypothetical protein VF211_07225 [Burkholderiales bacterium]